jgi:hypothetical protein
MKEKKSLLYSSEECDKIKVNNYSLDLNTSNVSENKTLVKTKNNRKKNKYKDLMSSIISSKTDDNTKDELYKKKITNSTGGGQFKKGNLDKI